jgi:hypothetical protein
MRDGLSHHCHTEPFCEVIEASERATSPARLVEVVQRLRFVWMMARPTGLEPVTFGSGGRRSIQLSYGRKTVDSLQSPIVKRSRQSHSQVAVVSRVVPTTTL